MAPQHTMSHPVGNAIEVESLTKRYGDLTALDEVSFAVRRGDVFALLGPNGAGKTTAVEIITTVREPTSGVVRVLGMNVMTHKRAIVRRIGVLPQGFDSFDRLTVVESIRYYARLFGARRPDLDALLALANLGPKRDVQFRHLSGGMKQRLGIVLALVNDPEVLFLDEPTTGLDPHARRAVWSLLLDLKSRGKTIVLTTHSMDEAELLADTVAILFRGRLVAIGSPEALIAARARGLDLTLRTADAGTLESIRRLGFAPRGDGRSAITVRVPRTEDVLAILSALQEPQRGEAATPLPEIDVRTSNLEEAFLSLTGEPLDPSAPASGKVR